jgi:hypothetical protein
MSETTQREMAWWCRSAALLVLGFCLMLTGEALEQHDIGYAVWLTTFVLAGGALLGAVMAAIEAWATRTEEES